MKQKLKFLEVRVDWIGHEDGSTAFMIRAPQAEWIQEGFEGGAWWDVIIRDWEQLK